MARSLVEPLRIAGIGAARLLRRPRTFAEVQAVGVALCLISVGPTIMGAAGSGSIALIADAVALALDTIFEIAVLLALRAIRRQNAFIFPYGTGRFETLISTVIGMSLLISSVMLFALSAVRLGTPSQPTEVNLGLVMIVISLAICAALWHWVKTAVDGGTYIAAQWKRLVFFDIVLNLIVLVTVALSAALGGGWSWLDAAAGVIVSCVMFFQAVRILRSSVWELSDRALEEEVQIAILRGLAESFDDFDDLIDVRSRRVAGQPYVDVVLGFDADRQWSEIIDRCNVVRSRVEAQVKGARVKVLPGSDLLWQRSGIHTPTPRFHDEPTVVTAGGQH